MSPFKALYGCKPPFILVYTRESTSIYVLDDALQTHTELLRVLKENLMPAQHRMTQRVNAHRRELTFVVGDLVLVLLRPYRQTIMC